ncbi:MAG: hypothetical protein WBD20_14835 [Pirellulaceae bacterium]
MSTLSSASPNDRFDWQRHPSADALVRHIVDQFCGQHSFAASLARRMRDETGTRLIDWVDHVAVNESFQIEGQPISSMLSKRGFDASHADQDGQWFEHRGGLFPPVVVSDLIYMRLSIQVESVDDFLAAHDIQTQIQGQAGSMFRRAPVPSQDNAAESDSRIGEFHVCERHGWTSWQLPPNDERRIQLASEVAGSFGSRPRECFAAAKALIQSAVEKIGVDWACDLFFAAERDYWQSRNHAAQVQYQRQSKLGLGWGNHDHHTYRSSRASFANLIDCLETLGFQCRERFYAGGQAGWGAQVLEQSNTGIVIFADVDLSPEELSGDFAHDGLRPSEQLGTVGLWCQLHGEAFLQAGMHHLECQFDFEAARQQLSEVGIETMQPFTDFTHLRQAFTRGEVWSIEESQIATALQLGSITGEQADNFRKDGAVGSHLEILERNDGFKGFNQTGVSEIIRKTDPRHLRLNEDPDGES